MKVTKVIAKQKGWDYNNLPCESCDCYTIEDGKPCCPYWKLNNTTPLAPNTVCSCNSNYE